MSSVFRRFSILLIRKKIKTTKTRDMENFLNDEAFKRRSKILQKEVKIIMQEVFDFLFEYCH